MSDNALTIFDQGNAALPEHLKTFQSELGNNIAEALKVPSLSYEGKIWAISKDGNKEKLMRVNDDGDDEPVSTMRVVVVGYNLRRGRAYYEGTYDPGNVTPPKCWSEDGNAPDNAVPPQDRQCDRCDNCPMSVKGSRISDNNKQTVACSQHRMLAVLPVKPNGQIILDPLRLKIAITSDWDAQSPEQEAAGWRSYQKYTDFLKSRGCGHTAMVVTKMKFDPSVAYPKIFFSAERFLSQEETDAIKPIVTGEDVKKLLDGTFTPAGVDGVAKSPEPEAANSPAPVAPVATPEPEAAPTPSPAPAPAPAPSPAPAPAPVSANPPAETSPAEEPAASTAVPSDLSNLLSEWGNPKE